MKSIFILLLLLCSNVRAEPTFVGVLGTAKDGTFFAVSAAAGRPAKWVVVGDSVDGYLVTAYRPKDEQLVLRKDGEDRVLSLKKSNVRVGTAFVDEAGIRKLARQIVAKWPGWDLSTTAIVVWYKTDWNVAATRVVEGKNETRIISAPDGFVVSAGK